jgi:hypothetical protein
MTDLSPAAEAVLNAYENSPRNGFCLGEQKALAAALRAAADQAAPFSTNLRQNQIHQHLCTIAVELEEVND